MGTLKLLGEPEGGGPHTHPEADIEDDSTLARLAANETVSGLWDFAQDIKMAAGKGLQDSSGLQRLAIAATSPQVEVTGSQRITEQLLVSPTVSSFNPETLIHVQKDTIAALGVVDALLFKPTRSSSTGFLQTSLTGLHAEVKNTSPSAATLGNAIYGFTMEPIQEGNGPLFRFQGLVILMRSTAGYTGALPETSAMQVWNPVFSGVVPPTINAINIENQGVAGMTTVRHLRIQDILAGTARYLIEAGPSTPYMRLIGGANPAANQTNLYLKEDSTLRHVQWKDGASIDAGDRVMVLV